MPSQRVADHRGRMPRSRFGLAELGDALDLREGLGGLSDWLRGQALSDAARPLRLRLGDPSAALDGVLLVQEIDVAETLCGEPGGLCGRLLCLATRADLPAELFIGLAVEVQVVTDRGTLRSLSGLVVRAVPGQSDGGAHAWMLEIADALAFMHGGANSRVFRNASVIDITRKILDEWRRRTPALAFAFDYELLSLTAANYPAREFTLQWCESDAAFLIRLWKKSGLAWFTRAGRAERPHGGGDDGPAHTLVLFDEAMDLPQNSAGVLRYHRDAATEARDGITLWSPVRTVVPARTRRASNDYKGPRTHVADVPAMLDQGAAGDALARALIDARIDSPHWGDTGADFQRLSTLRMQRFEFEAACVRGGGGARELAVGTWIEVGNLPGEWERDVESRRVVLTEVRHTAANNLPKDIDARLTALFVASGWRRERPLVDAEGAARRYANTFSAVRRGVPIVPAFDAHRDWPRLGPNTAVVVGPPGEVVHCDELGRVKVQLQGLDPRDHEHAAGAGTSGTDYDGAWLRVMSPWASRSFGAITLPRIGDEVVIEFLAGDPDKPFVAGALYNARTSPPTFSHVGRLPGNRFLSGAKSREARGARYNQLRFDDTHGQISAQLASEHGYSELNLGYLTHPRRDGVASARGEGAELRTDGAAALRGGEGVFISADARAAAGGHHLDRAEFLGLVRTLRVLVEELGRTAATHHAEDTDSARLKALIERLEAWENGSNTAPEVGAGAAPLVAMSAPAGIAVGSADNVFIGAGSHVDVASAANTQFSAGQQLLLRAADLLSAFARQDMRLVAATGTLSMEAHAGNIEAVSAKCITLTAAEEIRLQAPRIVYVAQGAQVALGGGTIVQQSSGAHTIRSASFGHTGAGGGSPSGVGSPTSEMPFDQRVVLRWVGTNAPMPNQRYRIATEDGRVFEGRSDAEGRTEVFDSALPFGRYTIEILPD